MRWTDRQERYINILCYIGVYGFAGALAAVRLVWWWGYLLIAWRWRWWWSFPTPLFYLWFFSHGQTGQWIEGDTPTVASKKEKKEKKMEFYRQGTSWIGWNSIPAHLSLSPCNRQQRREERNKNIWKENTCIRKENPKCYRHLIYIYGVVLWW